MENVQALAKESFLLRPIANGTVIDHLVPGKALFLMELLKLNELNKPILLGLNLLSSSMKVKDLIKVEEWEMPEEAGSLIAVYSPHATINIIQNHAVIQKYTGIVPKTIQNVITCPNPCCITHQEKTERFFSIIPHRNTFSFICKYCEKRFTQNELIVD